jgi:hypothetical protein
MGERTIVRDLASCLVDDALVFNSRSIPEFEASWRAFEVLAFGCHHANSRFGHRQVTNGVSWWSLLNLRACSMRPAVFLESAPEIAPVPA